MNFESLQMVVTERRELPIRPVFLKFGVALAISLGGVIYTFSRTKRIKPSKSKSLKLSSGNGSQVDLKGALRDDDLALQNTFLQKVASINSIGDLSSSGRHSGDKDGFLLPEFNELVKECNKSLPTDDISPMKKEGCLVLDTEKKSAEHDEHDIETRKLRSKIRLLEERERKLEIQLIEYYGIKEQEAAVIELQNRLRLNNMEAKLYNLKIESLLSDNRRLEVQLADHAKVVMELEAAKAKIKLLRKKFRSEAEQNREQISTLKERVMKLQELEKKADELDRDVEVYRQEKEELKGELEETKKSNEGLKQENSDLTHKLEYLQMLAASALDNEEVQELKQESQRLKQLNEDLTKEMKRVQADRCTDIEELVYLRWVNACLQFELKNQQTVTGKTNGRDSKTVNPKSEEKAKANKDRSGEKAADLPETDFEQWSPSQASCLTDSGERDDSSVDTVPVNKPNHSGKSKAFAKLRKLLRRKGSPRRFHAPTTPLARAVSVDDIAGKYSRYFQSGFAALADTGTDDLTKTTRDSCGGSSRRSLDLPRSYSPAQKSSITGEISSNNSRRISDDSASSIITRINSLTEDDNDMCPGVHDAQNDAKTELAKLVDAQNSKNELLKYAEALKNARTVSLPRRST
ncbi:UNVERIFIED_CONTAM: protein CHUP1, chloroplastic [Sesamum radiatum]|uniref:Protein CHUP1, chloroplastic n=1 Tax=Sesamum radiatum TaxID=300843 RepID=A0AAW2V7R5_SESRA